MQQGSPSAFWQNCTTTDSVAHVWQVDRRLREVSTQSSVSPSFLLFSNSHDQQDLALNRSIVCHGFQCTGSVSSRWKSFACSTKLAVRIFGANSRTGIHFARANTARAPQWTRGASIPERGYLSPYETSACSCPMRILCSSSQRPRNLRVVRGPVLRMVLECKVPLPAEVQVCRRASSGPCDDAARKSRYQRCDSCARDLMQ